MTGQMMVEFCRRKKMMITNTWFDHNKRRRYTWKKPGDTERFQLDYIAVRQRYRNSVKNARSYPGADIDSDHNLVMMNVNIRLKRNIQRARESRSGVWKGLKARQQFFRRKLQGY